MDHPLDRPVWSALTSGWARLAKGGARALQLDPAYGPFAAPAVRDDLTALADFEVGPDGLWLTELDAPKTAPPPGLVIERNAQVTQMLAEHATSGEVRFEVVDLTESDAPAIRALAQLTKPGPFAARTHQFSQFIGVKRDGVLVAMAGERMRLTGYAEVSGVCTHPDHRGQGYAAGLMRLIMHRMLARGEQPFLHAYAANTGAIGLYETLGFAPRREVIVTVLRRG